MKIYSDDPNLPYKTTKLKVLYTKSEIGGLFAKWGVKVFIGIGTLSTTMFLFSSKLPRKSTESLCMFQLRLKPPPFGTTEQGLRLKT